MLRESHLPRHVTITNRYFREAEAEAVATERERARREKLGSMQFFPTVRNAFLHLHKKNGGSYVDAACASLFKTICVWQYDWNAKSEDATTAAAAVPRGIKEKSICE